MEGRLEAAEDLEAIEGDCDHRATAGEVELVSVHTGSPLVLRVTRGGSCELGRGKVGDLGERDVALIWQIESTFAMMGWP